VSLPVTLRLEASRDAEEARDYFDARQAGLGQAFLDQLKAALARISAMPEMYGVVWRNVPAARLRQFTYVVYYRVHDDRVEVLAVMHGGRDASAWQARARGTRSPECPS
jgi:plasmid stabilization system protein ParE